MLRNFFIFLFRKCTSLFERVVLFLKPGVFYAILNLVYSLGILILNLVIDLLSVSGLSLTDLFFGFVAYVKKLFFAFFTFLKGGFNVLCTFVKQLKSTLFVQFIFLLVELLLISLGRVFNFVVELFDLEGADYFRRLFVILYFATSFTLFLVYFTKWAVVYLIRKGFDLDKLNFFAFYFTAIIEILKDLFA